MPDIHGVVGVILFTGLLVHSVRQIFLINKSTPHCVSDQSALFLQLKLYFHVVFALNSILEILFNFSLILYNGENVRWGYSLHLVGLYCGILSFLLVIRLWNHVLFSQRLLPVRSHMYVIFLAVIFVSLVVDLSVYNIYGENDLNKAAKTLAIISNIVYVSSLFVASCVLLWFGYDLKNKLTSSPAGISDILRALLRKINISLLLLALCYGARIMGVGYIILMTIKEGHSPNFRQRDYVLWVLLSFWIPSLGTGLLFLHIMHHRPSPHSTTILASQSSSAPASVGISSAVDSTASTSSRLMSLSVEEGLLGRRPLAESSRFDGNDFAPQNLARNRMDFFSSDSALSSSDDYI